MKRVMVPHQLLVWVVVDLDSQTVQDVWTADLHENYTLDVNAGDGVTYCLWGSEELEDEGDPVDPPRAREAIAIVDAEARRWPELRIEESHR